MASSPDKGESSPRGSGSSPNKEGNSPSPRGSSKGGSSSSPRGSGSSPDVKGSLSPDDSPSRRRSPDKVGEEQTREGAESPSKKKVSWSEAQKYDNEEESEADQDVEDHRALVKYSPSEAAKNQAELTAAAAAGHKEKGARSRRPRSRLTEYEADDGYSEDSRQ